MSTANGRAKGASYTTFVIGGEEYRVPPLNLYVLQERKDDVRALGPDLSQSDYCAAVIRIIITALEDDQPELDEKLLQKACAYSEMDGILASMRQWMTKSGIIAEGEAEATTESSGTGTSLPSSPNLPPMESAPATLTQ